MLTAYVNFNGNTEAAFSFYQTALGGELVNLQRFGETPQGDQMSPADRNKIMHVALEGPHGIRLMGSDYIDFNNQPFNAGNNFALSLHPNTEAQADVFFKNLSAGGAVDVPMGKAPWGDYFGMFSDAFGIKWMINCPAK